MFIKILLIFIVHVFAFLGFFGIHSFRNTLMETYQLSDSINYTNIFGQVATYDLDGFLAHLRTVYLIFCCVAFVATVIYYLRYESQAGSTISRRPMWWTFFLLLMLVALGGSLLVIKLPEGESWGISLITTPIALIVTVLPYYLSTLFFCDYDTPGSQFFKSLFAGKGN